MGVVRRLVLVAVVFAALCQVSLGSAEVGAYYVDGARFFVKPQFRIDLSGTGSWYIGNSHWLTWSPKGASATTTFYTNICQPNCAAGRLRLQPATVRFFGLVPCRGREVFSRFKVVSPRGLVLLSGAFRVIGYLSHC